MGMRVGENGGSRQVRTFQEVSGSPFGSVSVSKSKKRKTKKKRVNYNYREISGRIIRAKKSLSANEVVISARSRVALLRRKKGTGDYNERELDAAIIHAEKMVRVAKKKLKNLKNEERAERGQRVSEEEQLEEGLYNNDPAADELQAEGIDLSEEDLKDLIWEMEQRMQEVLEDSDGLEELTENFLDVGEMSCEDLERWKKKHRSDELREIIEADMKYLKAMFQRMAEERQDIVNNVILELGNTITPVTVSEISIPVEGGSVDVTV